jgi:RNA polymerase sigma factor (sigma-70 family)
MSTTACDLELITRWRAGDNSAGNLLVKRHFQALHRFFSNKAQAHHEDLIQQTFMACVEAKDALRGESSFRAYLFAIARFQLLTHYRHVYRTASVDFTTTSICDLGTSPSGALARNEQRDLLQRALQQIPIDQQIALELTYWEELPAAEVAQVLNVPLNTVYSRVRRAREHLRDVLERFASDGAELEGTMRLLAVGDG